MLRFSCVCWEINFTAKRWVLVPTKVSLSSFDSTKIPVNRGLASSLEQEKIVLRISSLILSSAIVMDLSPLKSGNLG